MSDVHEQHELEALKSWWKANGLAVLTGGVLAVSSLFAWQSWQSYQRSNAEAASHLYESLRAPDAQADFGNVAREARRLMVEFPDSTYAVGAAFMLAKHHVAKADWVEAESNLNWVMTHATEDHWRAVATVRLARVLVEQDKTTEALTVLAKGYDTLPASFKGMADYLSGMALKQKGDEPAAQAAFKKAQANPDLPMSVRSLSQLWLDDLTQAAQ